MTQYLQLVTDQKKGLERDIIQKDFMNDFEMVPSNKTHFEFKIKMQASQRSMKTSLVPLFKLADEIHQIKVALEDTLDVWEALGAPNNDASVKFKGKGKGIVSSVLRLLESSPRSMWSLMRGYSWMTWHFLRKSLMPSISVPKLCSKQTQKL